MIAAFEEPVKVAVAVSPLEAVILTGLKEPETTKSLDAVRVAVAVIPLEAVMLTGEKVPETTKSELAVRVPVAVILLDPVIVLVTTKVSATVALEDAARRLLAVT